MSTLIAKVTRLILMLKNFLFTAKDVSRRHLNYQISFEENEFKCDLLMSKIKCTFLRYFLSHSFRNNAKYIDMI